MLEDDSSFFDISFDLLCERDLYVRYELERLRLQVIITSLTIQMAPGHLLGLIKYVLNIFNDDLHSQMYFVLFRLILPHQNEC